MDELFWTLRLAKDTFASYAAQFQKEGECRWESGTPDFSFHSLRVPVPSLLLLRHGSLSSPNPLLPQTQGVQASRSFLLPIPKAQPSPVPHPLSHAL